jgi:hypothetical protein
MSTWIKNFEKKFGKEKTDDFLKVIGKIKPKLKSNNSKTKNTTYVRKRKVITS